MATTTNLLCFFPFIFLMMSPHVYSPLPLRRSLLKGTKLMESVTRQFLSGASISVSTTSRSVRSMKSSEAIFCSLRVSLNSHVQQQRRAPSTSSVSIHSRMVLQLPVEKCSSRPLMCRLPLARPYFACHSCCWRHRWTTRPRGLLWLKRCCRTIAL